MRIACARLVLPDEVRRDVLVELDDAGVVTAVEAAGAGARADLAVDLAAPAFANTHSHAFHRLLRGRTNGGGGDFWRWREEMYRVAGTLDPDGLRAAATAVYAMRRRALAQLALLVSLAALVPAVLERTDTPFEVWAGVAWGVLGIGWVALALLRRIEPPGVGLVGGGLIAVYGLQTASFEGSRGWMLTAVVAVSVALLALAVTREHASLLMVPGGIGLLVAVPQLVDHVLDDDLATWLGVLLTGVVLVGLAVWMVRDRTQTRT